MTDNAFDAPDFLRAVRALRVLSRRHADLAHYAAQWWDDEEFNAKVAAVDIVISPYKPNGIMQ
jgi:hypothetical protein